MRFASARSREVDDGWAADEVIRSIRESGVEQPDLVLVFMTQAHRASAARIQGRLREELGARVLLGCTCEGVIGADDEIEREAGLAVLAGTMPGVGLRPFHVGSAQWSAALEEGALAPHIRAGPDARAYLVLGDPFSTPVDELLAALDALPAGAPTVGGMASGAQRPGRNALLLDDELHTDGAIGVALSGPIWVDTVVSQGCRPIGRRFLVTSSSGNMVEALSGQCALDATRELVDSLEDVERQLLGNGLFLGVAIDEYRDTFDRGDFLVRSVVGVDRDSGALAVGDAVRPGQTVQFHVRDAETADEDLRTMLAARAGDAPPAAALLFSCNGRGTRMFDTPCHDISALLEALPGTPVAGFFAAGELGPVGGRSFIHGHTASIALLRPMK